ncbi:DOMON domain [Trinorchestia longiramus]|nr:DOMON domain [Trinorchestia longiramus]
MLVQGSSLEVTWHLAYPHQGGYRIELLDQQQRVVADLTNPDGETLLVDDDPTAQSHRITLPKDTLCSGCTLRLLRQASEWGPRYQFWSCADVDIVKRRFLREKCSGNGIYMVDKCRCNKGFYGTTCQYTNECEVDADCGVYGKCFDIDATSYPKKQCYCQQGRFGPKCSNSSLLRLPSQLNLNLFTKKELSPKLSMYYRVLKNEGQDQIEVALVGNGTSYLAVGWRPSSATTACRQFPYITGELGGNMWKQQDAALLTAIQETASKAEPEPSAEGEPEPEAEGEPEPEAEGEPEPSAEGEPEPSAEGEPEPSAEGEPEPSAESESKSTTEGKPEPEPEPESTGEPEPNPEPKPETEATVPESTNEIETTNPGQGSLNEAESTGKPPSLAATTIKGQTSSGFKTASTTTIHSIGNENMGSFSAILSSSYPLSTPSSSWITSPPRAISSEDPRVSLTKNFNSFTGFFSENPGSTVVPMINNSMNYAANSITTSPFLVNDGKSTTQLTGASSSSSLFPQSTFTDTLRSDVFPENDFHSVLSLFNPLNILPPSNEIRTSSTPAPLSTPDARTPPLVLSTSFTASVPPKFAETTSPKTNASLNTKFNSFLNFFSTISTSLPTATSPPVSSTKMTTELNLPVQIENKDFDSFSEFFNSPNSPSTNPPGISSVKPVSGVDYVYTPETVPTLNSSSKNNGFESFYNFFSTDKSTVAPEKLPTIHSTSTTSEKSFVEIENKNFDSFSGFFNPSNDLSTFDPSISTGTQVTSGIQFSEKTLATVSSSSNFLKTTAFNSYFDSFSPTSSPISDIPIIPSANNTSSSVNLPVGLENENFNSFFGFFKPQEEVPLSRRTTISTPFATTQKFSASAGMFPFTVSKIPSFNYPKNNDFNSFLNFFSTPSSSNTKSSHSLTNPSFSSQTTLDTISVSSNYSPNIGFKASEATTLSSTDKIDLGSPINIPITSTNTPSVSSTSLTSSVLNTSVGVDVTNLDSLSVIFRSSNNVPTTSIPITSVASSFTQNLPYFTGRSPPAFISLDTSTENSNLDPFFKYFTKTSGTTENDLGVSTSSASVISPIEPHDGYSDIFRLPSTISPAFEKSSESSLVTHSLNFSDDASTTLASDSLWDYSSCCSSSSTHNHDYHTNDYYYANDDHFDNHYHHFSYDDDYNFSHHHHSTYNDFYDANYNSALEKKSRKRVKLRSVVFKKTAEPLQDSDGTCSKSAVRHTDRLSGLLVPSRKQRDVDRHGRRSRRFAVPLLKSQGNETQAGEVVPETAAVQGAESEPEGEAEPQKLSGDSPWVPRGDSLHAMDCTDIVVGMANGNSYRIMDYYTRDRSTPRPDAFWGGEDSLTAALGWEEDGVTTIVFRRPLQGRVPLYQGQVMESERSRRFAVPLLKSQGNETQAGEVVPETAAVQGAESEPEPEGEAEPQKLSGDSPWVPRGDSLHAMDCTDIVVGMANGNSYRIMDYYTRDRSTPRPDAFWGGEDSLTAALGWEEDGVTTIVFRRPLQASHPSDQPFEPGLMHIIWAMGQESGQYVHSPPSGLEKGGTPSVPDFYKRDELKYHGKQDQRGTTSIDIIGSSKAPGTALSTVNWCGGEFGYPAGCSVKDQSCQYHVRWEYLDDESDLVHYKVSSTFVNKWTGIGFSDNTRMSQTDVVVGFVDRRGEGTIFDGWLVGYSGVIMDRQQSIDDKSATQEDGILTLEFKKKRSNNDKEHDLSFTDDQCLYLVYPVGGGSFSEKSKRLSKHGSTPLFSTERVCIRSCSSGSGQNSSGIVYTTTPKPPQLLYAAEILFSGYKNFKIPGKTNPGFQKLADRFKSNIEPSLKNLPGYNAMEIESLSYKEPGNIMAKFEILLDKNKHEEAGDLPALVADAGSGNAKGSKVYEALQKSISEGTVGDLPVNTTFLKVDQLLVSSPSRQTDSGRSEEEPTANTAGVAWGLSFKEFLNVNKIWIIVGVVIALLVIALIQAIVTISKRKKRNNSNTPPKSKGPLMTNSGFKDYSRGNLNYAYETFETEENGVNGRRLSGNGTSGGRGYSRSNGGMNQARGGSPMRETREHHNHHSHSNGYQDTYNSGHHPQHHSHKSSYGGNGPLHHYNTQPSGMSVGDTKSLQRPRQPPAPRDRGWSASGMSDPRTTYSLPRGAHAAPAGYDRNPMAENTPDFYYLPSQRKYSGSRLDLATRFGIICLGCPGSVVRSCHLHYCPWRTQSGMVSCQFQSWYDRLTGPELAFPFGISLR